MNGALKSLQLLIGILTGLLGLVGILGAGGYYFFVTQTSNRPPIPGFAEERDGGKSLAAKSKPKPPAAKPTQSSAQPQNPNPPQPLPPEVFDAKVVWKGGLSLKKDPNSGAEKLGSVAFNAKVAIIKTSDDKQWLLIRSPMDNVQGWVKAGNIDRAATADTVRQSPIAKPRARSSSNNP